MTGSSTKVTIQNPKNNQGLDLSDHFPIVVQSPGLKIVSYNLQFMPGMISVDGKKTSIEIKEAVKEFADYFAKQDADVCCTQELFNNDANALLEKEMLQKGYVATNRVGGKWLSSLNGGARTFVKERYANELSNQQLIYKNTIDYFIGGDALVNKGVLHTSFEKKGVKYHVFNTHLQAFYTNRDHYAEVTLAQCVEFKRFVEKQKRDGLIGSNDKVIICGDMNIPKPKKGEDNNSLYLRMEKLMGTQFHILDYDLKVEGPQYTRAIDNSYNRNLEKSSDIDVNLDMAIEYNSNAFTMETELADIYSDIQLTLSKYVKDNATLFSKWHLSANKNEKLNQHVQQFNLLIEHAQKIQNENKNPMDDEQWFTEALVLLQGPGKGANLHHKENTPLPPIKFEEVTDSKDETSDPKTLDQYGKQLDQLLYKFKDFQRCLHHRYMHDPNKYQDMYSTALKMNHVLLNAKLKFYKNPTLKSFNEFQNICELQLAQAEVVFKKDVSIWNFIHPQFKNLIGILAAVSVLPILMISNKAAQSLNYTFFKPSGSEELNNFKADIKNELSPSKK